MHTPDPWQRLAKYPREFPTGAGVDTFPLTTVPEQLVARTVFTLYLLPPTDTGRFAQPVHAALCACGQPWRADSAALLRKLLGGHSCVEARQRPIELVPIDDQPTRDTIERVLSALRGM